ncbi:MULTISPECIES: DUF3099 domain-containing protein [Microbacterium]|uniref:DUF3099 domain-containing protein n=1 Tax=Microbacterium TaxID=33882 RepID=UPI00217D1AA8|nr:MULTISPECIES: DUF3099 domain-containing protein [Microbacterium]UWF76627.1 DUF3099 domain-containing protein [Microbacterium neungamense]WCM54776.1 DUF3099 domain-containing protein [Microbacterium sp. EF45047]
MKHTRHAPAVTSLPQAPHDEASHRVRRYALTMGIRMVCFLLMAFVQPYGWWTWVFAIAAAVLPYIAVVFANAGSDSVETRVESPGPQLGAPATTGPEPTAPDVITIHESPDRGDARADERDEGK